MSYSQSLDEIPTTKLEGELERREELRKNGLCDYCERAPETTPCMFPERHKLESLSNREIAISIIAEKLGIPRENVKDDTKLENQEHKICVAVAIKIGREISEYESMLASDLFKQL